MRTSPDKERPISGAGSLAKVEDVIDATTEVFGGL